MVARQRDANIEWLLSTHPVTADMLVTIGWFPTKAKALRRLHRLVMRRRIRLVGTVQRRAGRPEHVYSRSLVKADGLLHEVELTAVCLRLHAERIVRNPSQTDSTIRADAEVWINGQLYALELDRGTMTYPQLLRRFRVYEGYPHFVLWICSTIERREGLRTRAECIRHCALFSTLAKVLESPHQPIWWSADGECVSLPRQMAPETSAV